MLVVNNLSAGYGRIPVLTGVSLSLAPGEYLGILGHNGMGKTTLMRSLMGQLPASNNSIWFEKQDITRLPSHQRSTLGIGLVPQGREIFPNLTVRENLRMGMIAGGRENLAIIEEILGEFPRLQRLLDRLGGALSGGEQQLLSIARCLCTKPRLMLLDEPTEGIQPSIIEEIIETLLRFRTKKDIAVILVEQNLDFITSLSQRILTMQKGRITGAIDPANLQNGGAIANYVGMTLN